MICFQISIFEPLGTILISGIATRSQLWFAFKLVSLNHWEQFNNGLNVPICVVICFQISIFEPLGTMCQCRIYPYIVLWFAFKLVSLNHWEQLLDKFAHGKIVVICFQISIFEPLGTITCSYRSKRRELWFAFKLVSLNHWEQSKESKRIRVDCCDLLSN